MTDTEVVLEVRNGNTSLFSDLVSRFERPITRHVTRIIHSHEQARDIVQETFLKAFQRLASFDTSRQLAPWLYRIATNLAIDWVRSNRPTAPIDDLDLPSPDPRPHYDNAAEIRHVLNTLPDPYRTTLLLHDINGLTHSEIADREHRTEATIRWRLSTARNLFRAAWLRRNPCLS